jgi:hypothetical protein
MGIWTKLTVKQAQGLYGVPEEIAAAGENLLWGRLPEGRFFGMDEERPFFALLKNNERKEVVTFRFQTIEPETWEFEGELPNPFLVPNGHLLLDIASWEETMGILIASQEQWPALLGQGQRMFRQLDESELASINLRPEWFSPQKRLYLQMRDPVADLREAPVTTILICSVVRLQLWLEICQFPTQALQDATYMPLYHGMPKIELDRGGMQEFIGLLREQLANLPDS